MSVDIEETLSRELREVADGLSVPALPPLPQEPPRGARHWQPLLVAAAVVLVVAGAVAAVATDRGGQEPDPAPPQPSPTRSSRHVRCPDRADHPLRGRPAVVRRRRAGARHLVVGAGRRRRVARAAHGQHLVVGPRAGAAPDRPASTTYPRSSRRTGGTSPRSTPRTDGPADRLRHRVRGGPGWCPHRPRRPPDGSTVSIRAVTDDGQVIVQGTDTEPAVAAARGRRHRRPERDRTGAAVPGQHPGRPGRHRRCGGCRRRVSPTWRRSPTPASSPGSATVPTHDDAPGQPGRRVAGLDPAGDHGRRGHRGRRRSRRGRWTAGSGPR